MKSLILLSGGIDSTTCLAMALQKIAVRDVIALNTMYGQKHRRERISARDVAAHYGVPIIELDVSDIFAQSKCALLSHNKQDISHETYAEQLTEADYVDTYVPFRNGVFLSIAAAYAQSMGASEVWYGAHADDAAGNAYPDCTGEFISHMSKAIYSGTGSAVKLIAPLAEWNKARVVQEGLKLNAPYHLTWSCYEGSNRPCGKCATCKDRAKAFEINGVNDPAL